MRAAREYEQVSIDLDLVRPPAAPDGTSRPLWSPSRRRMAIGLAVVVATSILAADTARGADRATSVPFAVSPPDRRVYSSARVGGNESTGIGVLDETTGRQLLRQASWRAITQVEGARIPILAYSPAGQVLAVLDARQLRADRLALLPPGRGGCWAGKTYVTCRVGTDTFRAWRYSS